MREKHFTKINDVQLYWVAMTKHAVNLLLTILKDLYVTRKNKINVSIVDSRNRFFFNFMFLFVYSVLIMVITVKIILLLKNVIFVLETFNLVAVPVY